MTRAETGGYGEPARSFFSVPSNLAILAILLAAAIYWVWLTLFSRSINADEGISIVAIRGVLEHGFPIMRSGYVYSRGYLLHYLIAGSVTLFGWNDLSLVLPNLLAGLGSLLLTYKIGADILKRPWIGVAAALLLATLTIESWYATSPRMYMLLQFWALLSTYAFWQGFFEGKTRYQVIAFLAIAAGTLSNQEGSFVALGLPVTALVLMRLRGDSWKSIFSARNIAFVAAIGVVNSAIAFYEPANAAPLIAGHAGVMPDRIGFNLNPINWGRHVLQLERSIPYSLGPLLLAYLGFVLSVRHGGDPDHRWSYLLIAFTVLFLIHGFTLKSGGHRHLFFLLPLYALIACSGVVALVSLARSGTSGGPFLSRADALPALGLLLVGVITSVSLSTLKQVPFGSVSEKRESVVSFARRAFAMGLSFGGLFRDGYGLPCGYDYRCDRSLQDEFAQLKPAVGPTDVVVSNLHLESDYYLGRLDGWLLFREPGVSYPTLERSPTDEYIGVRIIDTEQELRALMANRRVWMIVTSSNVPGLIANQNPLWRIVTNEFRPQQRGRNLTVYVSGG